MSNKININKNITSTKAPKNTHRPTKRLLTDYYDYIDIQLHFNAISDVALGVLAWCYKIIANEKLHSSPIKPRI